MTTKLKQALIKSESNGDVNYGLSSSNKAEIEEKDELNDDKGSTEMHVIESIQHVLIQQKYDNNYRIESATNDVSSFTQIRLITWKNYKSQIARRKCPYCCKMCCPLFFILIMGIIGLLRPFLRADINCDNTPCPNIYVAEEEHNLITDKTITVTDQTSFIPRLICGGNWWIYNTYPSYLAVVWDETQQPQIQNILNIMASHYGDGEEYIYNESIGFQCLPWSADTSRVNFTEGSLLKYFDTSNELESYIGDDKYGQNGWNFNNDNVDALRPIAAAIVFKSISNDNKIWDYSIRLNSSSIPDTFGDNELKIVDRFTRDGNTLISQSVNQYIGSGFLELQSIVDNAITEYISVDINSIPYNDTYTCLYNKGFFLFPFTYFETDVYWNIMQIPFITFMAIIFIYPIIQILSILVLEKSNKIKEGMKMMGATSSIYWISMYLWFFMEFTIICAFITGFGYLMNVFEFSDPLIIILWFWIFCLTQMSFNTLISTFFDNPKTAIIVGFVLYFILIGLGVLMNSMNQTQFEMAGYQSCTKCIQSKYFNKLQYNSDYNLF